MHEIKITIEGKTGSGKTVICDLIRHALENDKRIHCQEIVEIIDEPAKQSCLKLTWEWNSNGT